MSGTLFIVSAPSGAGKTSLLNCLQTSYEDLQLSISHTTRCKRSNEQDGIDYHFVSAGNFQTMLDNGEFLEHAKVFNNWYGTNKNNVNQALKNNIDLILEIDWQGAKQVMQIFKQAVSIFILPPSMQVLSQRLRDRAQDDQAVIKQRLSQAQLEMSQHKFYDYTVINDDFDQALSNLKTIINSCRLRTPYQIAHHKNTVAQLTNSQ